MVSAITCRNLRHTLGYDDGRQHTISYPRIREQRQVVAMSSFHALYSLVR